MQYLLPPKNYMYIAEVNVLAIMDSAGCPSVGMTVFVTRVSSAFAGFRPVYGSVQSFKWQSRLSWQQSVTMPRGRRTVLC